MPRALNGTWPYVHSGRAIPLELIPLAQDCRRRCGAAAQGPACATVMRQLWLGWGCLCGKADEEGASAQPRAFTPDPHRPVICYCLVREALCSARSCHGPGLAGGPLQPFGRRALIRCLPKHREPGRAEVRRTKNRPQSIQATQRWPATSPRWRSCPAMASA